MSLESDIGRSLTGRIVLLHGLAATAKTWWRIAPSLAVHGGQTTAIDLPGHGSEPRLSSPLTLDILVSGVQDRLSGPVELLVGHSLGALAALALAARNHGVARALVLEEPPGFASVDTGVLATSIEEASALARSNPVGFKKRLEEENPLWAAKDIEYAMEGFAEVDEVSVAAGLRGPFTWNLSTMFAAVNVPVLLILAPDAPGRFPLGPGSALRGSERERVTSLMPVGRLELLEGGHALHRDQPGQWLSIVKRFADKALKG